MHWGCIILWLKISNHLKKINFFTFWPTFSTDDDDTDSRESDIEGETQLAEVRRDPVRKGSQLEAVKSDTKSNRQNLYLFFGQMASDSWLLLNHGQEKIKRRKQHQSTQKRHDQSNLIPSGNIKQSIRVSIYPLGSNLNLYEDGMTEDQIPKTNQKGRSNILTSYKWIEKGGVGRQQ